MTFDEKLEKFQKEVQFSKSKLNENALNDFFRGLTKKAEKLQAVPMPTYRLENPKKNLPILRQKLGIDAISKGITESETPETDAYDTDIDIFDNITGQIKPDKTNEFKIVFYNAFAESDNGIVTIDNIIRGRIGTTIKRTGKPTTTKSIGMKKLGTETPIIPKDKAGKAIEKFIQQNGLAGIIKIFGSYEKAQKGGLATRMGGAIRTGVGNALSQTASEIGNTITTKGVNYI